MAGFESLLQIYIFGSFESVMLAPLNKRQVHTIVSEVLEAQILDLKNVISSYQESANDDVKNTAGDKHEVNKAQMQWEVEKSNRQLANLINMKKILIRINPEQEMEQVSTGSLIKTDQGFFFLSIGLGKVQVNHEPVMCISIVSPLAQALLSKKVGDMVDFNDRKYHIEHLY
jgi:transcription elongation GreA/GreB family factor